MYLPRIPTIAICVILYHIRRVMNNRRRDVYPSIGTTLLNACAERRLTWLRWLARGLSPVQCPVDHVLLRLCERIANDNLFCNSQTVRIVCRSDHIIRTSVYEILT